MPLSELLIVVGVIGALIGLKRGVSYGGPALVAGVAAFVIGTAEVLLREHRAGYRSHALILAILPVVAFHSVVALGAASLIHLPRIFNIALLAVDLGLFVVLFRLLRARFAQARHKRALSS